MCPTVDQPAAICASNSSWPGLDPLLANHRQSGTRLCYGVRCRGGSPPERIHPEWGSFCRAEDRIGPVRRSIAGLLSGMVNANLVPANEVEPEPARLDGARLYAFPVGGSTLNSRHPRLRPKYLAAHGEQPRGARVADKTNRRYQTRQGSAETIGSPTLHENAC